ncbi:MAG: substrate-binding domain-containing protein [Spirochaetota bacterium]
MGRRPTRQDIADSLGISIITVHRALNDSGYVSVDLRERIRAESERIGYRPHRAAQSLVRSSNRELVVFSTESPTFHWDAVERGVRTAGSQIADFGYDTRYERIPRGDTGAYLKRLRSARRRGVAAVAVVNNLEYEMEAVFAFLDRWGVPYATLNIDAPTSRRRAFVGVDHAAEGRLAANFIAAGARRGGLIAVVSTLPRRATAIAGADIAAERFEGCCETARRAGLHCRLVEIDTKAGGSRGATDRTLDVGRRLTGVYLMTADPEVAREIATATRAPIVAGSASPDFLEMVRDGSLSAIVYQNPVLQGYYAVRALEHLVEGPSADATAPRVEPQRVILVHNLLLRENMNLPENHQLFVGTAPSGTSDG